MPHWFLVLVTAAMPAKWLHRHRRDMRWRRTGLCLRCGYDLRGSTDSGRCPECGTPAPGGDRGGRTDSEPVIALT